MDLNVAVATNELFENNDMVFPILMGRENLKVSLASPGSESSGVSSLDAEEAKKMANDQMTTSSSSPELASEPNSSEQTEGESSDENNEIEQSSDDETSTKQQTSAANGKLNVTIDEQEQRSPESANKVDDEPETIESNGIANDNYETKSENENEQELPLNSFETTKSVDESYNNLTATTHEISALSEDDLDDIRYKRLKMIYDGRDILDLANNMNQSCNIQYTHLPEYNIPMYMSNRSQYHRLGSSWDTHELKYGMCLRCGFQVPEEPPMTGGQAARSTISDASSTLLCDLSHIAAITAPNNTTANSSAMMQNMTIASALPRISPINSTLNPTTPKFQPSTTPLPGPSGQMFSFNNMNTNNNPSNNQHSFGYQNHNSMSVYKQQHHQQQQQQHQQQQQQQQQQQHHQQQQNAPSNAFYGNMTLNSMISQLAMETNNAAFNPNPNPNQYLNGGGNGTNYTPNNINQMANNLNTSAIINQLMNQNRQNQGGMCRPSVNKSGINLNANSHNKMPAYKMYSHF